MARLMASLRELLEADDPGDVHQKVLLDAKKSEIVQDLVPVAEVRKVILDWRREVPLPVRAEPRRLQPGFVLPAGGGAYSGPRGC